MPRTMLFKEERGIKVISKFKFLTLLSIGLLIIPFSQVFAQGSITGTVSNSDMGVPADSELTFWGFLDDNDEEIRTELSDGAGYQNPYWWDDFQNYGTEASGNPYDYLFSNLVNGEAYHLAGLIPSNSYQEENIVLASASNPSKPTGVTATVASTSRVVVRWNKVAGITYHIYRRLSSSNGSLFRLDNPSGSLSDPGVSDSFFVDTTVDGVSSYTYMVIGEDASGNYTPHSDETSANSSVPTAPVVASISPDTGPTSGGTFVTIEGENFDEGGVSVTIGGGTATSVVVVSPFEITCLTPSGSSGSADVVVTNTASGLSSSPLTGGFTYYLNTPPIADAGPDQTGVIAGSLVTLDGSGSFDINGDSLGYHWSQISGPSVVLSDSNAVNPTFTPNTGGSYYFQLYVDDAIDYSQADTVLIAVENQSPVLDSIGPKFVDEDQTLEFRISATDSDGDSVILTAENVPTNASFVDSGNGAGSFTFNPDYTQAGAHNVRFIASDGSLADSELVAITVNDINRTPVLASIGSKDVDEGQNLEFRVSASDLDGDSITLTAENVPINATFVDSGNGAGSFTFNPDYTQDGIYNVRFIASDGSLADSELVQITVNDLNRAPVLDSIGSKLVDEGQSLEFRISSTDLDGDALTLSAENVPPNATFVDSGNGAGSFTFNPDYTQAGTPNVRFIVSDGSLADSELVVITVNDVNRAPVADAGSDQLNVEASTLVTLDGSGSYDPDGDSIGYHWSQISGSSVTLSDTNAVDPTFTPVVKGSYEFELLVDDALLMSSPDTVLVSVDNQAPVLDSIGPKFVDEGQTLEFRISSSDSDGDALTLSAENVPANASFVDSGNGAGSFTFNPDYDQAGPHDVTFIVSDGSLADSELVVVTVNDVNRSPVLASLGSKNGDEGQTLEFRVSSSDPDGDSITLTAENVPINASFVDSGNGAGSFTFNPTYDQAGAYNVTFITSDGSLADSELVAVTINDVNRSPVLASIGSKSGDEGQTLEFRVSSTDPDGDSITLTAENVPINATFVDSGNGAGSFTFNPTYDQAGGYNVTFIASDGTLEDSELVQITINDVNRSPVLDSIGSKFVNEGQTLEFRVHSTDPDGDAITLTAENVPTNATFVDSGNGAGSFTFNPNYTQSGLYNVIFISSDGSLADSESVSITVNESGNQAPVLDSVGSKTVAETGTLEFRIHATEPDGDAITLSADSIPSNAVFVDSGNGAGSFTFNPDYDQAGVLNVTFIASDGSLADSETVEITITNTNRAPVLDSIGSRTVIEGGHLGFVVSASDPDADILTLTTENAPLNATFIDSGNGKGLLEFDPDYTQSGLHYITFKVTDGDLVDSEVVEITVIEAGNQFPVLDSIGAQTVAETETLIFKVSATDPDAKTPALMAFNWPANSAFVDSGNGNGSFSFYPNYDQGGIYTVGFIATDGFLADTEMVEITVTETNRLPVLDSIGSKIVTEGQTLEFRISATDPDENTLILSAENMPANASLIDSGNGAGSFTFNPDYTQSGLHYLTFIVSDGSLADSETVEISVNEAGNQAPVLDSVGSKSVDEGQTLEFRVSATDPDGDAITLSVDSIPSNAVFVDSGNGAGSFTFNPDYYQAGAYNVIFITSDGSLADSELVVITVNDVNQAPVLDSIGNKIVNEGQTLEFRVSASDPDGDSITLTAENVPINASFVDSGNGAGSFTFNPDYTQSGLYNVTFITSDGLLADSELISITVNEVGNHAPVLDSIGAKSVNEGQSLEFRISATDPDGDAITLSADSIPLNASFVDSGNGAGSFTFNPDYDQAGTHNVTFITSDGSLADSELVVITVNDINQAPALDSIGSKIVQEGQTLEFRFSASDPDGDGVTLSADSIPLNASFVDSGNGAGSFTFNPDYTQSGLYHVIFVASDGLLSDSESVSISVNEAGNQAPVLDSIGARTVDEGQTLEFRISASDPDFDSVILTAENTPLNASLVDSGNGAGSFTFNPDYEQAGTHNVIFIVSDGILADSESVAITVNDVNRAPVLDSIGTKIVNEGQTLEFRVSASDPDGDAVTLTAADVPPNASFVDSGNGAGSFTFDPDYTQSGLYSVTFKASDGILPDSEIVSITVNEAGNQVPVLDSIGSKSVDEGQSLEFRISATDPDGDAITLSADSIPLNASFVDSGNGAGSFTFNPDYTQAGSYNVTFIASDGSLADSELVVIMVNDINQAPVLDSIGSKIVEEGQTLEFRVSATDPDGDAMVLSADSIPLNASFVDSGNGTGSFSFNPTYTQSGLYNVIFVASDGLLADSELISISVNEAGNQAPVLDSVGSRSTQESQTLEFRISASDLDNDSLILSAVDIPTNATLVDSGNGAGSFTFNPDYTQAGIYNVTFIVSDGFLDDSELVEITVSEAGNQTPVIDSIGPQVIDEGNTLSILVNASDPDNDSLLLSVSDQPSNSTFIDSGNGTGLFTFTPDFYQASVETVSFVAMEKRENPLSDYENVIITIIDINQPPVFDSIGPQNVAVYETLSIRVVGTDPTDPDGGALHLTAMNLPLNSTFTDSGGGIGGFVFDPDTSQLGTDTVIFYCSDEGAPPATGQEMVIITVQEGTNQAPILESIGSHMVAEAETLSFTVSGSDPNGTIPILYTSPLPINATFVDSGNGRGLFTFAPDYSQQGLKEITFYASDGELVDNEDVLIQVTDAGNQMPILDSIGAKSVTEGDTLSFSISATDPDSTVPQLYAENLPINASFVDNAIGSGVFTFTPEYVQSGTYDIIFFAYDGELADSELVQITVNEAGNQTPIMTPVDSQVVVEGQQLVINIQAIDPDSTIPFLRAWNVPDNATFTDIGDGNGTLDFNPSYFQAGLDTVIFEAVDYEDSLVKVSQSVQITVQNVNRLPVFQQVSTQQLDEGDTLIFNVIATDPDSTFPTLFCTPKPQNSTFFDSGNGVGTFSFYPAYFQAGTIYPMFFAIDNEFPAEPETASMQVQIIINDVPQPPSLADIPDTSVFEGDTLILEVNASDPDGISPVLSALGLPFNSSFVDNENGTGTFTFTPNFVQAGTSWVSFIATDLTSMADTLVVQIVVTEGGNQAPVLLPVQAEWTIPAIYGDSFVVSAADPDSTVPVLTAAQLPNNASFYDSGNGVGLFTFIPDTTQADSVYEIIFIASDGLLDDSQAVICSVIAYTRGDANGDGNVSIVDAVYLINYLFNDGPTPLPWGAGDASGDGEVSIVDAVYLVNYLFNDGPPPPKIEWMGIGTGENDKSKWENLGN